MNTFFGIKFDQSQDFDAQGNRIPLTWVKVSPLTVIETKNMDKNHYDAYTVAFGTKKNPSKPLQGLLKNLTEKISPRFIREIRQEPGDSEKFTVGGKINISDVFNIGDLVKVTGTSKGKGFAGVVKRHGFHGGPKTHGQSTKQRHPGSIGAGTTPGRIYKGKRMAGHMGNAQVTIKNLIVHAIKPEENLLGIKGLIPGFEGSMVKITKA